MEIDWGEDIKQQIEELKKIIPETGETIDFLGQKMSLRALRILAQLDVPLPSIRYWQDDEQCPETRSHLTLEE